MEWQIREFEVHFRKKKFQLLRKDRTLLNHSETSPIKNICSKFPKKNRYLLK
jgi:hypothetical protein